MGSVSGFVGTEALKAKLNEHLAKLEALASRGEWEHLSEHTAHPDSGFDWWMFPSNRPSRRHGDLYQVSESDIEALKKMLRSWLATGVGCLWWPSPGAET